MIPKRKPGRVPEGRLAVLDHAGNMRGHLSPASTGANASRMLGGKVGATLGKDEHGKPCWHGKKPGAK